MSDPLGRRTERPHPVKAAAADNEQVGARARGDERGDGFVQQLLAAAVDDQVHQPPVNCLTAIGDDRP